MRNLEKIIRCLFENPGDWSIEDLDQLMETTTSSGISVYSKPIGIPYSDPTMGRRNVFRDKNFRKALEGLRVKTRRS